jgi:hypothetical protein
LPDYLSLKTQQQTNIVSRYFLHKPSISELLEMGILVYLLSVGLTFEVASIALQSLKEQDANYAQSPDRWMLFWDNGDLKLERFDRECAIALIEEGLPVIPICLTQIQEKMKEKLFP